MTANRPLSTDEQQQWLRKQIDAAVKLLSDSGVFRSATIEVKPAWASPGQFLIGKAREPGESLEFRWFISSDHGFFDQIAGDVATSPREAARHFSMKWQLDAARAEDEQDATTIAERAEFLYALVDEPRLWNT